MGSSENASSHDTVTSQGSGALSQNSGHRAPKSKVSFKKSIKAIRLVNWNVEILCRLLNAVVARREVKGWTNLSLGVNEAAVDKKLREGKMVINEVEEVITLPKYKEAAAANANGKSTTVSTLCVEQLREFVMEISGRYMDNPFHSFEHASHVSMSVSKLLSRIVAPKASALGTKEMLDDKDLHDHTYGITSDPLTQFACIFSALIHDAEHEGVPNTQLVKEETALAAKYKNQSVAEQNSVDVSWNLLMEPRFQELRNAIYGNEEEMMHFRRVSIPEIDVSYLRKPLYCKLT